MKILRSLYKKSFGCECRSVSRLPQAGGYRVYYRLDGDAGSAIGVYGPDRRENESFLGLTEVFSSSGLPVPAVYGSELESGHYLIEDLGETPLLHLLQKGNGFDMAKECMRILPSFQTIDRNRWDKCVMTPGFSRRQAMWDLNYFKYEYLKPSGKCFDENLLENDFEMFADQLSGIPDSLCGFMYRDFQSRNVMVKDSCPYFIDYQGGRWGPCIYDAVSFLWQAKAGFSDAGREELLNLYSSEFSRLRGIPADMILANVTRYALFRTLQVLGAYGFRGLVERRAHFIESIPQALLNLGGLFEDGAADAYPELKRVCSDLVSDGRFEKRENDGRLTVSVFSFSYKKGYPEDYSGNGGGFMFDCRAMHNPGRYDDYKHLTGRDLPVVEFLEQRGEVQPFLAGVRALVDPAVERYRSRGFTGLQIGFGCTGGQHRSVYCAESTARRLASVFPDVIVRLIHREQGIEEIFNKDIRI